MCDVYTWFFAWGVPRGATTNLKSKIRQIVARRKYLSRHALFHAFTKIEVGVSIARIGGDIEFIHFDEIEAVKGAVA